MQNAFKEALATLPQRVLWKYDGEMEDKPKNVMTRKWFPQRDILGDFFFKLIFYSRKTKLTCILFNMQRIPM